MWQGLKPETKSLNLLCYVASKISKLLLNLWIEYQRREIRRVRILKSAFPLHLKNSNVWPHRIPIAFWQQQAPIKLSPLQKGHALASLPSTPWPCVAVHLSSRMRTLAGLAPQSLNVCAWAQLHTFLHVGTIWVTCVSHYSTSQFCTNPSLWSLEGIYAF